MPNLIGTAANQVPTNGTLGTAAFINAEQLPISAPQQAALDGKQPTLPYKITVSTSAPSSPAVGDIWVSY